MVEREQRESTKQIQTEHLAQGATVLRPTTCHSLNENGLHGRKHKMTRFGVCYAASGKGYLESLNGTIK